MKAKLNQESDIARVLELDNSSGRKTNLRKWVLVIFLATAMAAAIVSWKRIEKTNSVQYKTQDAVLGNLTATVTATGDLQPTNTVEVGSELSGIVKSVEGDYNDRVKVGQVLAKLDTTKLDAQVTQSKASLESARANVLQAQATLTETRSKLAQFRKVRELSNNKVPSQTELDAAEAAFERAQADVASARAAVSQAKATLEANETDLSKSVIHSPIHGIVLARSVEVGQTVAASFQAPVLFTLAEDLTKMELHVDVDEADIGKVREGQKASFNVAAYPNRTFEARITQTRYGSSTTSGVVTYETVLKVDNEDLSLRPGMTATAEITVKEVQNAVLAPSAALRFTPPAPEEKKPSASLISALLPRPPRSKPRQEAMNDKNHQRVWTLKNGELTSIPVTTGSSEGGMTEIVSGGVEPGMALVVDAVSAER
jgi:HlyD family secretion protein